MPKLIPELKVKNFTKSIAFYTKLAGFTITYDRSEDEFAMLNREGAYLMIESLRNTSRLWKVGNLEHPFGRGMHFQIEVADIEQLFNTFKSHNYPIFFDLEDRWYRTGEIESGNRQFLVQDSDGYLLRFFQDIGTRAMNK